MRGRLAPAAIASRFVAAPVSSRACSAAATFRDFGPTPKWDPFGGPAVQALRAGELFDGPAVRRGVVNRVVWMCWTGHNPMPAHLRLCMATVERNSGLPVILVTPRNVARYVPEPHPVYEFLHLQHRADYLRACLLHFYGGVYLDMDTICLRRLTGLFDRLDMYDAVGYDGQEWGELVGISDMGPFRAGTALTALWFNALHGKLQQRAQEVLDRREDVFYWQEILRDIFVPVSLIHRDRICTELQAHNPSQDDLWSLRPAAERLGRAVLERSHVLILNNAKYGQELENLTEEQILGGPAVLSQVLRQALGSTEGS